MELDGLGLKIKKDIITYLKEIKEYHEIEDKILLDSTAIAYQMYDKYLTAAEEEMLEDTILGLKLHALSQKYYVNYTTNLKSLGITAIQRKKLGYVEEDEVKEDSIIAQIGKFHSGQ